MAYTLGSKCVKNLCKRIVLLQLIIENVVTCFLEHCVDILKVFSPSGSPTILVSPHQTGCQYSDGNPLTGASNARGYEKTRFSTNIGFYLDTDAR